MCDFSGISSFSITSAPSTLTRAIGHRLPTFLIYPPRLRLHLHGGEGPLATDSNEEEKQPDFEAIMAAGDSYGATIKALEGMEKSKKKKGKKQNKAHKRK